MIKEKAIAYELLHETHVKKEYQPAVRKLFGMMEIVPNKKYGATATITWSNRLFRGEKKLTKLQELKRKKRWDKLEKDNKHVDTSKWVKPDEASIQNALISELFLNIVYPENSDKFKEADVRADVLYSILHSHHPKNPQSLTNFGHAGAFEVIIQTLKGSEQNNGFKAIFKNWNTEKWSGRKDGRKRYQAWKEKCIKNMISVKTDMSKDELEHNRQMREHEAKSRKIRKIEEKKLAKEFASFVKSYSAKSSNSEFITSLRIKRLLQNDKSIL